MNYKSLLLLFIILPATYSCKNKTPKEASTRAVLTDSIWKFQLPEIPTILTSSEQRLNFLVNHYWDNINIADTNFIHNDNDLEQAWANYCDLLNRVPLPTAQDAIKSTFTRMNGNKNILAVFQDLADKYLYDPNSPMREEEYYIPVLETLINTPTLDEVEKIRPRARLKLALKNRPGTIASDFVYTLKTGTRGRLHKISTDYTILFINNPGCHACAETIGQLRSAEVIEKLHKDSRLTILAIYPDEDLDEWKKHIKDFPEDWINGYDKEQTINNKELYDLKAIPTLYLLDENKVVLLKDATFSNIVDYLYRL